MPEGGLFYFHVSKDGKPLDAETVSDLSKVVRDGLHKVIWDHFKTYAPEYVEHFQVELNDYGLLIDFASSKKPEQFQIPDLTAEIRKHTYVVTFDRFEPEEDNNDDEENENENENENVYNGGAIAHRRIRSPRRSLRSRVRKTYRKRAAGSRKHRRV